MEQIWIKVPQGLPPGKYDARFEGLRIVEVAVPNLGDPCDAWERAHAYPAEPKAKDHAWYRGWEIGWDYDAHCYGGTGWVACKGGADLDCPCVMAATYGSLLDEIDDNEDEW